MSLLPTKEIQALANRAHISLDRLDVLTASLTRLVDNLDGAVTDVRETMRIVRTAVGKQ